MPDVDRMLEKCGDFGRYQFFLLSLFAVVNVLTSWHYYSQTIISVVPDHWCSTEATQNLSIGELRQVFSTYDDPFCSRMANEEFFPNIWMESSSQRHSNCDQWIYDLDFGYQSMTSDLNWVCESAWKSTIGQSMYFIGSVVGTLSFGILADKIGRLPILVLSNCAALLGNGATIFSTSVPSFCICRFISGLATDSNFVMMYILVMEYIRPSMRTFGLNICIGIFYCLGSIVTPWIAVAVGNWKVFLMVTSLPIAIIPGFYFILPESVHWLISKGDVEGAINCFRRVAIFNRRNLDEQTIREFRIKYANQSNGCEKKSQANLFDLFKTPRLRRNTFILFFKSMVITLCYDCISRNVEGLGLSPFILFSLSATAIFPACLVLWALQDKIGRKAMASSSLLISGIFTTCTGIVLAYQKGAATMSTSLLATLAVIGRFGVTVAYNSSAQYATELIPTSVRAQGVSAVHVAGYAVTFFSTFILYLAHYFKPLPALILGGLSLAGAVLCLFLPETLNRTIPSTIEEGERFGIGEKFLHFSCFEKSTSDNTSTVTTLDT
ncbi:organic cation transporter protein-like [Phlebotomus papatasi]|uniref:organic cation transporter protein-like n=1 Tax=Phlebotomus papatasi TaxID=29031 RepID=UPI002483D009|nr:organic cation transporter protein-like [Phlebotomus papatasi]